jgi:parallel beta-helix repeat protein
MAGGPESPVRNSGPAAGADLASFSGKPEIEVGAERGDLRGDDHRALQAAVDYVAALGGGTVRIAPGRYLLRNAVVLRDDVRIVGSGDETVLALADGATSPLALDGDCNQRAITLQNPEGFQVGDGVAVWDDQYSGGFEVTTATLTARIDEDTFAISRPLYLDYLVRRKATAARVCPGVGGWNVKNAAVEAIAVEGNAGSTPELNGCRGGGIYLFECEHVTIRDCTVRDYHGDGISFQVSQYVHVENCTAENNTGIGIHPGSGSQHPVVADCVCRGNGSDGLFVCWRVQHGLFANNTIEQNRRAGISIGHKDCDNRFVGNTVVRNSSVGVLFRNESEAMGAHRNVFQKNRILDNALNEQSRRAAVLILGPHHDLVFRDNEIGRSAPGAADQAGIVASDQANGLVADENDFINVSQDVERSGKGAN